MPSPSYSRLPTTERPVPKHRPDTDTTVVVEHAQPHVDSGSSPSCSDDNEEGLDNKEAHDTASCDEGVENGPASPTVSSRRFHDFAVLTGILVMSVWPWIFWGVVRSLGGVKMKNSQAKVVEKYPQTTAFFVSLVGNFICLVINILFSLSVIRFAQEWVADKDKVSVFHVSLLGAFRNQSFPWTVKDLGRLFKKKKWLPVVLVGVCIIAFQSVPSSMTSLLLPVPFQQIAFLSGTELDFSSLASDCIEWLDSNPFLNDCDWQDFRGTRYTSCLGQNQLSDVLAAGRSSILSLLPNNTESLSLSQLGAKDGMRILGPLRGILPIGPNGAPSFDTLKPSPFTNPDIAEAMLAYNYTLNYQGLFTNMSCGFDDSSPINFARVENSTTLALKYSGTCPEGSTDFLVDKGVLEVVVPNGDNGMGWWACRAPFTPEGLPSYHLYMRGRGNYLLADFITNITCLVSPIQPAVYPVTYQSTTRLWESEPSASEASNVYIGLIEYALVGITGVFKESQNYVSNLVAESVITLGIKSFGLPHRTRDEGYPPLFAAMIQGMLDYEVSYSRLVWSTNLDYPESCIREVTGNVTYTVVGWSAKLEHIGFLMPVTIVNAASLFIILAAIIMTKGDVPRHLNPTDPRVMLEAAGPQGEDEDDEWERTVSFRPSAAFQNAQNNTQILPSISAPVQEIVKQGGRFLGAS